MINRYYVACSVCSCHHTLRVQIGIGPTQRHRFGCHGCDEPIDFDLFGAPTGPTVSGGAFVEPVADDQTSFQYLATEILVDAAKARDPGYFGSFDLMSALMETQGGQRASARSEDEGASNSRSWSALTDAPSNWAAIQRACRLGARRQYSLEREALAALVGYEDCHSAHAALASFSEKLFGCNDALLSEVTRLHDDHTDEFSRLACAYVYEHATEFRAARVRLFAAFFGHWDAFSHTYLYVYHGAEAPANTRSTSLRYDEIRGFYASAQEFFAQQVVLLTALSNISAGRPFDQLGRISLAVYLGTDNAKRRDNFVRVLEFESASREYDSSLRNAEAHNWIQVRDDGHTLVYRHGGDGAEVSLSYADYLLKSVGLFRQVCQLLHVEHLLSEKANAMANQLLRQQRTSA